MAIRTFNSVGGFSVGEVPTTVILANGDITTGNATLTGNVQANTAVKTDSLLHLDGTPWDFQQPAGSANGQIQYYEGGEFGASANLIWQNANSALVVIGNIQASNFVGNVIGNISGNITIPGTSTGVVINDGGSANSFSGFTYIKANGLVTITGNILTGNAGLGNLATANYFSGDGSLLTSITGANVTGYVSNANAANTANTATSATTAGTVTTNAQPNITSVGTLSSLDVTGNISAGNITGATYVSGTLTTAAQPNITSLGTLSTLDVSGNVSVGNLTSDGSVDAIFLGGVLTTTSQPNITSVGTLANLTVTGNANIDNTVNAGNLNVIGRVYSSLLPSNDNTLTLGNSSLKWANIFTTGLFVGGGSITATANVLNIDALYAGNNISAGSLTVRGEAIMQGDATISGNLTVAGNTTYINVTNLDIKDPLISLGGTANGGNASAYDGKDRGLILHNYYANGSSAVNQAFIWDTGNNQFEAISQVDSFSGEVVVAGAYANIKVDTILGNLSGTIITGNQYLITNVGTLGNLNVTNTVTSANANITSTLKASGLTYPTADGSVGQVLTTYGNGTLTFSTIDTYRISNGTSNVTVFSSGNVTTSVGGVANVIVATTTGANIKGYANVTGNAFIQGNATVGNVIIGDSSIRAAKVVTSTTSLSTIATIDITDVRGVIFDVTGEQDNYPSTNKYSIATVTALQDGTNVDYAVYGTVLLGGATGTLSCSLSLGNLYLQVTPASSADTTWTVQYRTL
jgi:hypothetical protein